MTFYQWCIENNKTNLLDEWDDEISPKEISYGSINNIKWRCSLNHTWDASPNARTSKRNSRCPFCAGRRVWPGFNDLKSQRSDLMDEWDYSENNIDPSEVYVNSSKSANWICKKGHKWPAVIKERTKQNGTSCPVCANQKIVTGVNDLAYVYPLLATEYCSDNKKPSNRIYCKSTIAVKWICKNGHIYKSRVVDRVSGNGCPYCANRKVMKRFNDLQSQYEDIAKDWDYDKNKDTPDNIVFGSTKEVYWKCKNGHSWHQKVYVRTQQGTGCPYCAGERVISSINDLKTKYPWLAEEWDYEKNGERTPENTMPGTNKKVYWVCPLGHSYHASPNARIYRNHGCPVCAKENHTSFPEQAIYYYLNKAFSNIENRCVIDGYELDIYIPEIKVAVEYDGFYYHSNKSAKERELRKDIFCKDNGIILYRVKETQNAIEDEDTVLYRTLPDDGSSLDRIIRKLLKICAANNVNEIEVDSTKERAEIWSLYVSGIKKNSLQTMYPQIASEWDYDKNGDIKPINVSYGSHKKVWWICKKGHSFPATIKHRTITGTNCPYCSNRKVLAGFNDLEFKRKEIAEEWDFEKNDKKPSEYTEFSNKRVWWKCPLNHSYRELISKRSLGRGCPICNKREGKSKEQENG